MSGFTLTLSRPVKSHKGDISEISFRDPVAGDLFDIGQPFEIERKAEVRRGGDGTYAVTTRETHDYDKHKQWLIRLSGLDGGVLGQVPIGDTVKAINWLCSLFQETPENPTNAPSDS